MTLDVGAKIYHSKIHSLLEYSGTAVAQWLRHCTKNRKVAGSIPAGVVRIFH